MLTLASSLLVALALDVPFVPQTEALCGGAATAMVFRFWGDTHADAQPFAKLVDRRAGGIPDARLVEEVRRQGWTAIQYAGSIQTLENELERGRPVIVLIQDRPGRFHFVVAIGVEDGAVVVHDPAWGPNRRLPVSDLLKAWGPTRFWSLVVLPPVVRLKADTTNAQGLVRPRADPTIDVGVQADESRGDPENVRLKRDATGSTRTACDRLLADAVGRIQHHGREGADSVLGEVRARCPDAPGPIRELAGVRFAERRWAEAASLAADAVARGDADPYAWDVLGSSRYMQNDLAGALAAWNRIGKPRVNLVRIQGVHRTRHALIAAMLDLPINALLTEDMFRRAEHRLQELPDQSTARLRYRPERDGYATVDVAIVERPAIPGRPVEWAGASARAAANREIGFAVPGATGQGELWSASWRWWADRPRAALTFTAPRVGRMPGVWRVEGAWEKETYAFGGGDTRESLVRETRAYGRLTLSEWAASNVRYDFKVGLDSWNGARRTASIGAGIDRRFLNDRLSLAGEAAIWMPLTAERGFETGSVRARLRSSTASSRWTYMADAGLDMVTAETPFTLWPATGDGHAREHLLRAHPLLGGGIIDGAMFGRTLAYANVEARRSIDQPSPVRLAAAVFADAGRVSARAAPANARAFQADVGTGLRVKWPGYDGTLRIDFAYGLRDNAHAFTFGWEF